MPKGKHWSAQEEADLKTLVEANTHVEQIAAKLGKTPGAIIIKCQRLGLNLQIKGYLDTSVSLPRELPSADEILRMLAGALKTAIKPGLNKTEIQRLQMVSNISKTYNDVLEKVINYHQIENKLKEMDELNAQLLKERSSNSSPQRDPAPVA
jgi:hypothetical protein